MANNPGDDCYTNTFFVDTVHFALVNAIVYQTELFRYLFQQVVYWTKVQYCSKQKE